VEQMIKVKFRVYVDKHCRKCRKVHMQPTHRAIYHQADGEAMQVIQEGSAYARKLLAIDGNNLYPLYQYYLEI